MAVQSQGRGGSPLLPLSGQEGWDWTPCAKSLGPGHPFLPQRGRGAKQAPLEAALNREVARNPVEATEGEGWLLPQRPGETAVGDMRYGRRVSTHHTDWHLLRFPWKCLLRQKKLHCLGKPKSSLSS